MSRGDFWSRRRAGVAAEAEAETRARDARTAAERQAEADARDDAEVLAELDLPAPEDMESPEQVQKLLRAAAPQRLKTRALRKLWRLNPVLANVDGLVDYGQDFTDASTVVENLQTAYQVGRGMLRHVEALAEADARTAATAAAPEADRPDTDGPNADEPDADDQDTLSAAARDTASQPAAQDLRMPAKPAGPAQDDDTAGAHGATAETAMRPGDPTDPNLIQIKSARPKRMAFRFDAADPGRGET